MDIVSRLQTYIKYTNLSSSQFADHANIPRPTLSQIIGGRNKKISHELIEKLHLAYPALSVTWLLFGDGPMLVDGTPATPQISDNQQNADQQTRAEIVDVQPKIDFPCIFDASQDQSRKPQPTRQTTNQIVDFEKDMESYAPSPQQSGYAAPAPAADVPQANSLFSQFENAPTEKSASRTIDYIVVFYTDKTFATYKKSNGKI